jgi:DNA-binding HxlR family transcriptional regulator
VGEKWSLLIVRNALRGQSTFSEFRSSLGIPTDVLTARLSSLVASGILEKEAYREPGSRERFRYVPTEAGVGLRLVLAAMIQWGDEFEPSPYGPASLVTDAATGAPAQLEARTREGIRVDAKHIAIVPGPASLTTW